MQKPRMNHSPRAAAPVTRMRANRLRSTTSRGDWASYLARYRNGEYRARIFFDMILDDVAERTEGLTILDIGCGRGFDGNARLQEALAARCHRYIGVEPDQSIPVGPYISEVHRCSFEEAPLAPDSVDTAFAVMALEHVRRPELFFAKVSNVLKEGGAFWGFTVDARHFFALFSRWADCLRIKNTYLATLLGKRGEERYENYPTLYRANTPRQIARHVAGFRRFDFMSLLRVGENDYCMPRWLHPLAHVIDRIMMAAGLPGSTLVVRIEK